MQAARRVAKRSLTLAALWIGALSVPAQAQFEDISTVLVGDGLTRPVYATFAPGDASRLFVLEQYSGKIKIFDRASATIDHANPFLTVPAVAQGSEQGLLCMAFHPGYSGSGVGQGLFYVHRNRGSDGQTRIEEYQVSANPNVALATPRLVLAIEQPAANHNGGWIGFGPDGFLYIAIGDGGGGNDNGSGHTENIGNAQDLSDNLLGKLLRIDVNGNSEGAYGIPPTNPFVGVAGDDEIFAYGLRNPWRASFDRSTHDLYIGDVGQTAQEEISLIRAGTGSGQNFGWRLREGVSATPAPGIGGPAPPGALDPIYAYPRSQGTAVIGGYVYRGPITALQGKYFFADAGSDRIWSLTFDGSLPSAFFGGNFTDFREWTSDFDPGVMNVVIDSIGSFAEDSDGNLYILDLGSPSQPSGEIFMLVPDLAAAQAQAAALLLLVGIARLRIRRSRATG